MMLGQHRVSHCTNTISCVLLSTANTAYFHSLSTIFGPAGRLNPEFALRGPIFMPCGYLSLQENVMNVVRYEPRYRPLGLLGRLLQDSDLDTLLSRNSDTVSDWMPAVDIQEETDRYLLRADLPGVDPENIPAG
jgi:hypothetical protein